MRDLAAIQTIAYRDLLKFARDPARLITTFIFPLLFIGALGGAMQANLGPNLGYNYLTFIFTGVFAQTLFQSTAFGLISLIEDRESDFAQEIFVAPISRYSIVFGKIIGESLVALPQGLGVIIFAILVRVPMSPAQALSLIPTGLAACLLGGAFGLLVLSNLNSQRAANQVFPFIMLPQYFLAGMLSPIRVLPGYLDVLSRISPLRYAVDFTRDLYYVGQPSYGLVVLAGPLFNLAVIGGFFLVCLVVGTTLFVRREQNR